MRALIAREKGDSDIWDLKLAAGGLIDIEFIAQYLQLAFAHEHPAILDVSTRKVVEEAGRAGLITAEQAEILVDAHRLYTDATQFMRLSTSGPFDPAKAAAGVKRRIAGGERLSRLRGVRGRARRCAQARAVRFRGDRQGLNPSQFIEQRACLLEVQCAETFGEPAVDGREDGMGFRAFALIAFKPRKLVAARSSQERACCARATPSARSNEACASPSSRSGDMSSISPRMRWTSASSHLVPIV